MYHKSTNGEDYVAFVLGPPIFTQDGKEAKYNAYAKLVQVFVDVPSNKGQQSYNKSRALSYDTDLVYNSNAIPLMLEGVTEIKPKTKPVKKANNSFEIRKVENKIDWLVSNGIDITTIYSDWVTLAFSFLSAFDKATAKHFFVKVSSVHPEYNRKQCEQKFDELASSFTPDGAVSINTFHYHFNNAYKNHYANK